MSNSLQQGNFSPVVTNTHYSFNFHSSPEPSQYTRVTHIKLSGVVQFVITTTKFIYSKSVPKSSHYDEPIRNPSRDPGEEVEAMLYTTLFKEHNYS